MPAIEVSEYIFFLKTFYLGHQLFRRYYARMQAILPELPFKLVEQEGSWLCPKPSLGSLINEALSMNQGMLGVLNDRLVQQQTGSQSAWVPACDCYLILNDQQNYHAFLVQRGLQIEQAINSLESFYRFNPDIGGASLVVPFKKLHQEAIATHQKMLQFLKDSQRYFSTISSKKPFLGSSFEALMRHLKKDSSFSKPYTDAKGIYKGHDADFCEAHSTCTQKRFMLNEGGNIQARVLPRGP